MVFMGIVLAVCIFTYILQRSHLKSEHHLESLVSRESSFLFNNLVLLAACFVILWGTLFPILSEYVVGNKVTVGAPLYNRVAVPIGLFLLFLTGVGPLLPWRSTSLKSIRRNFVLPIIALWATVIVCLAVGVRPWKDGALDQGNFYALVAFALSAAVFTAILSEFLRGAGVIAKQTGRNLTSSIYLLTRRNTRRYGGYIIHIGVVIIVIGLAGAAFNRRRRSSEMAASTTSWPSALIRWSASASPRTPISTTTPNSPCWMSTRTARESGLGPLIAGALGLSLTSATFLSRCPRRSAPILPAASRRPWSPSTRFPVGTCI